MDAVLASLTRNRALIALAFDACRGSSLAIGSVLPRSPRSLFWGAFWSPSASATPRGDPDRGLLAVAALALEVRRPLPCWSLRLAHVRGGRSRWDRSLPGSVGSVARIDCKDCAEDSAGAASRLDGSAEELVSPQLAPLRLDARSPTGGLAAAAVERRRERRRNLADARRRATPCANEQAVVLRQAGRSSRRSRRASRRSRSSGRSATVVARRSRSTASASRRPGPATRACRARLVRNAPWRSCPISVTLTEPAVCSPISACCTSAKARVRRRGRPGRMLSSGSSLARRARSDGAAARAG